MKQALQHRRRTLVSALMMAILSLAAMPASAEQLDLQQAITRVKAAHKARILNAEQIKSKGPLTYRIKVLFTDGRVKTVFVDGKTGEVFDVKRNKH